MSMRTLLDEVRTALTSYSDLTDLIPADKITLARRPQRDSMPGITFAIGTVDYDPTFESFSAATTYRIDTTIYGQSADQVTQIHDQVKLALANVRSSVFSCRVTDERYMVDVDNNHMAEVQSMWLLDAGIQDGVATLISPAWRGHDVINIQHHLEIENGGETNLESDQQFYHFNFQQHQGSALHDVNFPEPKDGKIITILAGSNIDSNSKLDLYPTQPDGGTATIERLGKYEFDKGRASATFVCIALDGGRTPRFDWQILWYRGLHT